MHFSKYKAALSQTSLSQTSTRELLKIAVVLTFVASMNANGVERNSTIIGRSSLMQDCYQASQQATLLQSATRRDVDICDRAVTEGAVLKSDLAASYSNRGVVHVAMENYTQAYKDYNHALKLDDELSEAYINRGNLWFVVQQYEKAIADYGKALELGTEEEAIALLNRGLAFESSGELNKAKLDYQASLNIQPNFQTAQDKLDRVNKKLASSLNE